MKGSFKSVNIRSLILHTTVFALVAVVTFATMSGFIEPEHAFAAENDNAPYPDSATIEGISWDFDNAVKLANGSDLWPTTWGPDNNIYTSWGDGGGFGGSNFLGRVSLGFARISGSPENLSTANIWGGRNPENPAQFGGKTAGIISVNGVLYAWINTQNRIFGPDYRLAYSTNLGDTWRLSSWSMNSGTFALASFLNFGKDYDGARDSYVYSYGGRWGNDANVYLARVHKNSITNIAAYQYWAGTDSSGNPIWSSNQSSRRIVFSDSNANAQNSSLLTGPVFNEGLDRYLMTVPYSDAGEWGIYDAPEPWGPWTTIDYYDNWGGYGFDTLPLVYSIATKWTSSDGLTVWMAYSGVGSDLDSFNLIKGTISLRSGGSSNGLVAHWKFDEGSGQSVSDASGNGHNTNLGSSSGADSHDPAWTSGMSGGALQFDGANDYVSFGDAPQFALSKYSWSMWIKGDSSPSHIEITQPISNADQQFVFSWDHGISSFRAAAAHKSGGQWFGSPISTNLDNGTWYHIAGVYDGAKLKTYLNGELVNSTSASNPNQKGGGLTIGAAFNQSNFFDGAIDDLQIYNRALSDSEIHELMQVGDTTSSDLLAHWSFDEGSGQVAADSSGNGHNGLLGLSSQSGSDDPSWTSGKFGSGLKFGGNDLVRVADHKDFGLPVYSWAMWIKGDAAPSGSRISQPITNASEQFVFSWDHTQSAFRTAAAHESGSTWYGSRISESLKGGTWYHIAATFDGSNLRIYLDGELANVSSVGDPNTINGDLYIGAGQASQSNPASFFRGVIDEVRIYGRAISSEEIMELANQ